MVRHSSKISAFDAKNRLGRLLDRVVAGEELIITRRGEPVAKLVPIDSRTEDKVAKAFETFRNIRESIAATGVKISRKEIKRWRDEGRR